MITRETIKSLESLIQVTEPVPLYRDLLPEILRLARLGLWAEEWAIPALRDFKGNDPNGTADSALSHIPEEK